MPDTPTEETFFAVSYAELRATIEVMSTLPFSQVREIVPRLEARLSQDNVVAPPAGLPEGVQLSTADTPE